VRRRDIIRDGKGDTAYRGAHLELKAVKNKVGKPFGDQVSLYYRNTLCSGFDLIR